MAVTTNASSDRAAADVLSLDPEALGALVATAGAAPFRGRQLFRAWWRHGLERYDDLTVWPRDLRERAAALWPFRRAVVAGRQEAADGTTKFLVRLADGEVVESVLLPHRYGWSACVSTQVGCAIGCRFCASGLAGKRRNLSAGEMLEQVHLLAADLAARGLGTVRRVDLMGIGEPLDNYRETVRFLRLVHHPEGFGLSYRHLTVSTSGLVPRMLALSNEGLPVTLAVSLHAPEDALRERLMPVNRAYPLAQLIPACETYWERTRRRITYEYLLIDGVNDGAGLAERLVHLIGRIPCHVNLIPWNPVPEHPFRPSPPGRVAEFRRIVEAGGVSCTVRRELGQEIQAACGQLRRQSVVPETRAPGAGAVRGRTEGGPS
jgi:23S rRNA (adenine2503-C2)-methyltransferase